MSKLALPATMACLLACSPALADDIGGATNILCTVLETQVCLEAGGCVQIHPEDLNVPRFLRLDTGKKRLYTTSASGENRETIADSIERADGQLILQGVEAGRGYSLFIHEPSGQATFASAAEGRSATAFAACTPAVDD